MRHLYREVMEVAPLPVLQWAPFLDKGKGNWEGRCVSLSCPDACGCGVNRRMALPV